jgi:hypothetical protein
MKILIIDVPALFSQGKKFYHCAACQTFEFTSFDLKDKKCPYCKNGYWRTFLTTTSPELLKKAKQKDIDFNKQFGRSGKMIDNGRDFNGRTPSYGERLRMGFRMLDGKDI